MTAGAGVMVLGTAMVVEGWVVVVVATALVAWVMEAVAAEVAADTEAEVEVEEATVVEDRAEMARGVAGLSSGPGTPRPVLRARDATRLLPADLHLRRRRQLLAPAVAVRPP